MIQQSEGAFCRLEEKSCQAKVLWSDSFPVLRDGDCILDHTSILRESIHVLAQDST